MDSAKRTISGITKNQFFKHGVPFFIIVLGGALAVKQFASLRYDFARNEKMTRKERDELNKLFLPPSEYNIETEYEKLKETDLEKWENKRIPRPWDE